MKMSYKIALVASLALLIVVVFLTVNSDDNPEADTQTADTTTNDDKPDRPTLMDRPTGSEQNRTLKNTSSGNGPATKPGKSLVDDVRNRLKAADQPDNTEDTTPDTTSVAATDESEAGSSPNAIPLTRTDPSGPSETITTPPDSEPEPAAGVNPSALDAILGNTSTPPANDDKPVVIPPTVVSDTPSDTPAATSAFKGGKYTVQSGDTFSSIADTHYGDESKWFDIAQANPTVDPTRLRVGQELKLPAIEALPEKTEPVPAGPEGVKSYTIRPGDSLSTVAEKFYDDPTLWRTIYNFNRDKIGDNPNAIQAGMVLKVPPRVRGAS